MTLKQVYTIYNTLMKIHRKYAADTGCDRISEFTSEINALNSEMDHPLCNDLTSIIYVWYRGWGKDNRPFMLDNDAIKNMYLDAWTTHRTLSDKRREMGNTTEFWDLAERGCVGMQSTWTGVVAGKAEMIAKAIWDSLERDEIAAE